MAVLPGDGIGVEVTDAACAVVAGLGLDIEFEHGRIGWECWRSEGDPIPPDTWQLLDRTDACLLGAITSKASREAADELDPSLKGNKHRYVSPVVQLRQRLELFANVRPVWDVAGARFSFTVIRENTEGLYAGYDSWPLTMTERTLVERHPNVVRSDASGVAASTRLMTTFGVDRILRFAFEYAERAHQPTLTVADKPNVLRNSGDFLRERVELVAAEFPHVSCEILNADAVAMWMVRRPERFGVIVAENMFGDVLSDIGAAVMGGLGLAPSANVGTAYSYFEPVHGSAPRLAGTGNANPMAMLLTVAALLDHLDRQAPAQDLRAAVRKVVQDARTVTYDLGGSSKTDEVTRAVVAAVNADVETNHSAAVVTIGDELLAGTVADTNATEASVRLRAAGYTVRHRATVGDREPDIAAAVSSRLGRDSLVVVMGGLGPTSDDLTRQGVATALSRELVFDEPSWHALTERMNRRGLRVHETNKRQALFPQDAVVRPNPNGTARGFTSDRFGTEVLVLPGPPDECLPMLAEYLSDHQVTEPAVVSRTWRLLGVIESDVGALVDRILASGLAAQARASYRWCYPYVDVTVECAPEADVRHEIDERLAPWTVSTDGSDAFEAVRSRLHSPLSLSAEIGIGELAFRDGMTAIGVSLCDDGSLAQASLIGSCMRGTAASLVASLRSTVRLLGRTCQYELDVPDRGDQLEQCAAAFYAWCLARALRDIPLREV